MVVLMRVAYCGCSDDGVVVVVVIVVVCVLELVGWCGVGDSCSNVSGGKIVIIEVGVVVVVVIEMLWVLKLVGWCGGGSCVNGAGGSNGDSGKRHLFQLSSPNVAH